MNIVLNSDSKQCPESKLGWVHTQVPGCAHPACALHPGRAHTARWALCRGPCHKMCCAHAVMSQSYCLHPRSRYKNLYSDSIPIARAARRVAALYRRPLSRYKNCIMTQLGLNQDTRVLSPRRVGSCSVLRAVSWPCPIVL